MAEMTESEQELLALAIKTKVAELAKLVIEASLDFRLATEVIVSMRAGERGSFYHAMRVWNETDYLNTTTSDGSSLSQKRAVEEPSEFERMIDEQIEAVKAKERLRAAGR